MSDELVARLAAELRPAPRHEVARRLALGVGAGAAVSGVLTAATLGLRPDMAEAAREAMFWVKLSYTGAIAAIAVWACGRLARPGGSAARSSWLLAPALLIAGLAAWQLMTAPPSVRMPMIMGHSAPVCPWCIALLSAPPFAGLVWAVRGLAPTRLHLAGAMAGLAAGGAGASAYALHCDESTAPFLAVWYTLGVGLAAAAGWLAGPRLLRW